MENEIEEWRAVVGFEGLYEVSSIGRVRSIDRVLTYKDGRVRAFKGVMLKLQKRDDFYFSVSLTSDFGSQRVHVMVAAAFHGPCPKGLVVRHIDGNGNNNKYENLEYGTYLENCYDAEFLVIKRDSFARCDGALKASDVSAVKALLGHIPQRKIAAAFGVSRGCITGIHYGKNWPNVVPCEFNEAMAMVNARSIKDINGGNQ